MAPLAVGLHDFRRVVEIFSNRIPSSMRWHLSSRSAFMLSEKVCADAREGDIGMQLGEIAKANPGVAIGSYPFFDPQRQYECGAARPRCTEARAGQTRGRGHAGASAASTINGFFRNNGPKRLDQRSMKDRRRFTAHAADFFAYCLCRRSSYCHCRSNSTIRVNPASPHRNNCTPLA